MKYQKLNLESNLERSRNEDTYRILANPKLVKEYELLSRELRSNALEVLAATPLRFRAVMDNLDYMRSELLKDGDSAIEQIYVDAILTFYLHTGFTGLRLQGLDLENVFWKEPGHQDRIHDKANRRFFKAMMKLQSVRDGLLTMRLHEWKKRQRGAKRQTADTPSPAIAVQEAA